MQSVAFAFTATVAFTTYAIVTGFLIRRGKVTTPVHGGLGKAEPNDGAGATGAGLGNTFTFWEEVGFMAAGKGLISNGKCPASTRAVRL